ncbi:MAG: VWA domain-containing protein [Vicinamibacterales bacterium]
MKKRLPVSIGVAVLVANLAADSPGTPGQTVYRSGVDLVYVTATVVDRDGRFVAGLTADDFVVSEEGRPQKIVSFSAVRVPVSLGIALDVSGSMTPPQMETARAAIRRLVNDLLGPDDELFFAVFERKTLLLQEWTPDRQVFGRALDGAKVGGTTALYDAVQKLLPVVESGRHDKKALLVVSDGDDRASQISQRDLQRSVRASDVLVYALGVDGGEGLNTRSLRRFTDDTGGRTEVVNGFKNLDAATTRLADELNRQYQLAYLMPGTRDGRWHPIKVEVRRKSVVVRARSGYVRR